MEKLTEQELVERFGNQEQKEKYKQEGALLKGNKRNVLANARKYCNIMPVGDGTYKITKMKKMAVTPDFIRTASGVYPYTCPLILSYVMEHDKSLIGKMSLATSIKMVADYYTAINANPKLVAESFDLDLRSVWDYLKHVTDSVNYYIQKTLDYLKQMQLILYTSSYVFIKGNASAVQDGVSLKVEKYVGTDEDMQFYKEAVSQADIYADTKNASERIYGKKAKAWSSKLHEILSERDIMNVFQVYEVWTVNKDKCREYREKFEADEELMVGLGKEFRQKMYDNAFKRVTRNDKYADDGADILLAYNFLSRICIGEPKLSEKTKKKIQKIVDVQENDRYRLIVEDC